MGELITHQETGLLLYNNGTVCDSNNTFDEFAADSICKAMGFATASSWDANGTKHWYLQRDYKTSLSNVLCPNHYSWSSCSYDAKGSQKICIGHYKDVFMSCNCDLGFSSCPEGEYYKDNCMCLKCPPNTFKDTIDRQTSCTICPSDSTSTTGSAYCACEAGLYWNEGKCHPCPKGSVSVEGSLKCVKCPIDSIEVNHSTACKCSSGEGWSWEGKSNLGKCRLCLPGTSYITGEMTSCQACPRHTTSDVGSDHCICPAGMFWNNTKCQNCEQGSVSQHGALRCQICPSHFSSNGTVCECKNGEDWTWDENRMGSCKPLKSSRVKLLLGFNIGLILMVFSALAIMTTVVLIKKKRGNGKNSEVNVISIPYAE